MSTAHLSVGVRGPGEDRCAVFRSPDRVVLVVADGAGGSGRGAEAAELVVATVEQRSRLETPDPAGWLRACDQLLVENHRGGETTAVVVVIEAHAVYGASVGDSGAWLISAADRHEDLTRDQLRKPLIGSGAAVPASFARGPLSTTLLLASDGLLKYAPTGQIRSLAMAAALDSSAPLLVDAARLKSGALQDDVAVVLCRPAID